DAALALGDCYDTRIPMAVRLTALGEILAKCDQIFTLERELLVWTASARWLVRNHSFDMAALAVSEYQSLSPRISDGKSLDVLNLIPDLIGADWLRSRANDAA